MKQRWLTRQRQRQRNNTFRTSIEMDDAFAIRDGKESRGLGQLLAELLVIVNLEQHTRNLQWETLAEARTSPLTARTRSLDSLNSG